MLPVPMMATVGSGLVIVVPFRDVGFGQGGGRWCPGRLEGGGEQVAGSQAAVGPPLVGGIQNLLLAGEVVEVVGGPDGLAQRQVAGQDDVFPAERDDHGTLHGPGADPGNGGELVQQLVVGQAAEHVLVQPAVRQASGEVAQGGDLPPGQPSLAEPGGVYRQQFGGGGEVAAEQSLDAGQGPAGGGTDSCCPVTWNSSAPYRSIGGSWVIHARGSKSGRSSMSRASTGSARRRWVRACRSHAVRLESPVTEPPPGWPRFVPWLSRRVTGT